MGKLIERDVKLAYVKQITEKKMTARNAAKELHMYEVTVFDWMRKYHMDPENALPGSGYQKPDDEESCKLREKVKQLETEVDFLKNVTAYFEEATGKVRSDKEK